MGIDEFLEDVQDIILKSRIRIERVFPYSDAGKIQLIREYGQLESEEYTQGGHKCQRICASLGRRQTMNLIALVDKKWE